MAETLTIILAGADADNGKSSLPYSRHPHLLHVAGKPLLGHILASFDRLPAVLPRRFVLFTNASDLDTSRYVREAFPSLRVRFAEETGIPGGGHNLYQIRSYLDGPTLIADPFTLLEADLSFLSGSRQAAVAWARPTAEPSRGRYILTGLDGRIREITHHPPQNGDRLSTVGMYYFPDGRSLAGALAEQLAADQPLTIMETINLLLARGMRMRPEIVSAWLDGSRTAGLLEMNATLLENGRSNIKAITEADGATYLPPAQVDPTAEIEGSIIGPNVSIGPGCRIEGSALQDCIVAEGAQVSGCSLKDSIIGRNAMVRGVSGIIIVGDGAAITNDTENRR